MQIHKIRSNSNKLEYRHKALPYNQQAYPPPLEKSTTPTRLDLQLQILQQEVGLDICENL